MVGEMAKRKRSIETSSRGANYFWDNPPSMSEDARKVYDVLVKRIPKPEDYGLHPEDIFNIVTYCEIQAWLLQRPFVQIPDTQEQMYGGGRVRNSVNPELIAWLKVARQANYLQHLLFKRKRNMPYIPPPESNDDSVLTAADFPGSVRESAIEAQRLLEGRDISATMPFALKIGGKAPGRA